MRSKLEGTPLPVTNTDYLCSWENIEHSLLTLDNDQFDILWKDYTSRSKEFEKKKEYVTIKAPEKTEHDERVDIDKIKNEIVADNTIFEMEKAFSQGDTQSVMDMLKKYK